MLKKDFYGNVTFEAGKGPDTPFIKEYMRLKPLYSGALKTACAKFEILDDEFSMIQGHDPIHNIESRLKTAESAYEKLRRRGYEQTPQNLSKLTDIAGVRVVCGYIEDIYKIARVFLNQTGVRLLKEKDYIKNPKSNGYRSLHLIVEIPVSLSTIQMGVSSSAVGINSAPSLKVTLDGAAVTAQLAFTADGKQQLSFSTLDFATFTTTVYTFILDGETLTISDGANTATKAAAKWDYSKFVFEGTKTLTDTAGATHTLVCLPKNGGKTPLFLYDGNESAMYDVTIAADGSMILEVTSAGTTLQIKVAADGTVTADYKPSDIPLPPPPPPAP